MEMYNTPKPKLPRKRKKAAIKVQGRKWYYDTIKLYKISHRPGSWYGFLKEKTCKFWRSDSVTDSPVIFQGKVMITPTCTHYW